MRRPSSRRSASPTTDRERPVSAGAATGPRATDGAALPLDDRGRVLPRRARGGRASAVGIVVDRRLARGIRWFGGALVFAALVRLVLPARDAGMLAVRRRLVDC